MPELHPPLSGMPLAFALLLCCIEGLCWVPAVARLLSVARLLLVPAVIVSSLAAFLSGYQASSSMGEVSELAESALGVHHAIGRFVLINSVLLGAFAWIGSMARQRQRLFRMLYLLVLGLQLALVVWAGTLGGDLVFSHRIGVRGS
jgi:uncharacterized membrane protein